MNMSPVHTHTPLCGIFYNFVWNERKEYGVESKSTVLSQKPILTYEFSAYPNCINSKINLILTILSFFKVIKFDKAFEPLKKYI